MLLMHGYATFNMLIPGPHVVTQFLLQFRTTDLRFIIINEHNGLYCNILIIWDSKSTST